MFCALSGETPVEPVVSVKTGHVFEKRLIEKYLSQNEGKDPILHEPLSLEDLIPLKGNKAPIPRPPTATSIPGMLHLFQNEWDALMLQTYTLKQQLDSIRQELAHALYQHDAATRVIARLIKERDEARAALQTMQSQMGTMSPTSSAMEIETGIPENTKAKIVAKASELSKSRKKRTVPETLAEISNIQSYKVLTSHNIHSSTTPGISCVDLHPNGQSVVTGGSDSNVILFNKSTHKVSSTLSGHSKKNH